MSLRSFSIWLILAALAGTAPNACGADIASGGASVLCHMATSTAEHATGVPDQLLDAISRVETGRFDPQSGTMRAWPWTINAQGIGHFYATKAEAIAAAQAFHAQGIQSMDVGCMQINIMYHPDAFASLDQAFDPQTNAFYAARFLTELFHQTGSWPHAAAAYHSQTPNLGNDYQRKVLEAWAEPEDGTPGTGPATRNRPGAAPPLTDQIASLGAGAPTPPTGGPLLGGVGRVIRNSGGPLMSGPTGRGLDAYRSAPIRMVAAIPAHAGGF